MSKGCACLPVTLQPRASSPVELMGSHSGALLTSGAPAPASLHAERGSAQARTHCLLNGVLSSQVLGSLVIIGPGIQGEEQAQA